MKKNKRIDFFKPKRQVNFADDYIKLGIGTAVALTAVGIAASAFKNAFKSN